MKKIILAVLFTVLSQQNLLLSQNEIQLTLSVAEEIFLKNNLKLIAERYSIDMAQANVIQARLFENPELNFEQNIYSRADGEFFDFKSPNVIQFEQLFFLAGKRKKLIALEKLNVEIAQLEFQELLRTLRNALRENFIEFYYQKKSIAIYNKGIDELKKLIEVYDEQYAKGNVSLMENARLKALLFGLQSEKFEIEKEIIELQKELNLLLNQQEQTMNNPQLETNAIRQFAFNENTYNLLKRELTNTPLLQMAQKQIEAEEANLRLQKSLRIPDLTVGVAYEREGELRPENVGLYFNIPIPFFNRNQGEIKVAEAQLNQNRTLHQQQEKESLNELYAAYSKANEALKFYQSYDKGLENDFERLIEGIVSSFERRTISMLEFIDYYETYKEIMLQLQEIEKETILSIEAINFVLGKNYFRIVE